MLLGSIKKINPFYQTLISNYPKFIDLRIFTINSRKQRQIKLSSKHNELNNNSDKVLSSQYPVVYNVKLPNTDLNKTNNINLTKG